MEIDIFVIHFAQPRCVLTVRCSGDPLISWIATRQWSLIEAPAYTMARDPICSTGQFIWPNDLLGTVNVTGGKLGRLASITKACS